MPTLQAGAEIKLSKKIAWYNEAGIKYTKGFSDHYADTSFIKSKGYKLKSEIRYYFKSREPISLDGMYVAANVFYVKDFHNRAITYGNMSDTSHKIDNFGVKKNVFGFNLLFGYQKAMTKKLCFEVYAGVGIRLRNINTVNEEYNKNTDYIFTATDPKVSEIGQSVDANAGSSVAPNFTLGLRLGFKL